MITMRKISLFSTLTLSVFLLAGCLKDKGFDNGEYGTVVNEVKAVAFPQAPTSPVTVAITGTPNPVTVPGPLITVEASGPASSDIQLQLAFDDVLVTAEGLTPLPAGSYTLSTMTPVIPKDSSFINNLTLTITNSDQLDPNIKYGVGIKITSASSGYQIARNMSEVIIAFAIKNKYDGVYMLRGRHTRTPYTYPYLQEMHLVTNGPDEVYFYWPRQEIRSTGHPIGTGPDPSTDWSWYGPVLSPSIVFNTTTDQVEDVYNLDPSLPVSMLTDPNYGAGPSYYDPATKTIYVYFMYLSNPLRGFLDTLDYVGPRP